MKANFEIFLIAMGRRAKRRVQLIKDARSMSSPLSIGRFSSGMERIGPSAEKERIGRFSSGMERTGPSAEKERIGRFSSGMERTGPSAEKERIGRFSTGMEWTEAPGAELEEVSDAA
jgi:hypothetical protein